MSCLSRSDSDLPQKRSCETGTSVPLTRMSRTTSQYERTRPPTAHPFPFVGDSRSISTDGRRSRSQQTTSVRVAAFGHFLHSAPTTVRRAFASRTPPR